MGAFDADSATGIFSGFAAPESGNSRPKAGNFYLLSPHTTTTCTGTYTVVMKQTQTDLSSSVARPLERESDE
jgi:hypothetical protein